MFPDRAIRSFISKSQNWQSKHFEKTKYGKKISGLKDSHKGETCFVIGNGPSLLSSDLDKLADKGIPTFGMNRVYNIFPQTRWRPTYYVSEDLLILKATIHEVEKIRSQKKFIPINLKWFEGIQVEGADYFFMDYHSEFKASFGLSLDCAHSLRCRGTVTSTCVQFAIYMGFSKIYLLGVDHNYSKSIDINGNVVEDKNIKDYFVEDYDSDVKDLVIHDMRQPTRAFIDIGRLSRKMGTFRVYNATRGGKLEVFERVDFDGLFPTT